MGSVVDKNQINTKYITILDLVANRCLESSIRMTVISHAMSCRVPTTRDNNQINKLQQQQIMEI